MTATIQIQDISAHIGETVTIQGWLYQKTGKGRLQFLRVRDGTGIVQAVVFRKDVPPEVFEAAKRLSQESSLVITGTVRADERAPGMPGGYELSVSDLRVVQFADEYPITPKEHGVEFLQDNRHLWIRSSRQWAIMRVRATVIRAIRDWLDDNGFVNIDTPILTPAAGEGTTTLFEVDYFGEPTYLAQTGQLYGQYLQLGQSVLLWADVSGRKVQNPPPPDRVLDGRTGNRILRPGRLDESGRRVGLLCRSADLGGSSR